VSAEIYTLAKTRDLSSNSQILDYGNVNEVYEVYFSQVPNAGDTVIFFRNGVETRFQPHSLNYQNQYNQLQQIAMPNSVVAIVDGNKITYENAYGAGIDLKYILEKDRVKEELIIQDLSSLVPIEQYVIDGGNPELELNFVFRTNAQHISIDGTDWDMKNDASTISEVYVKDESGDDIYWFAQPVAYDSSGSSVEGRYIFKESNKKLYVSIRIPYMFLESADYPVYIDPTYVVDYSPIPARYLYYGDVDIDLDNDFSNQYDITSEVSDNSTATKYETYRYKYSEKGISFFKESKNETDEIISIDGVTIDVNHDYSANKYALINNPSYFSNGDILTFYVRPKDSDDVNYNIFLTNSDMSKIYGKFTLGSSITMYEYKYVTLSNIGVNTSNIYLHNNESEVNKVDVKYDYVAYNQAVIGNGKMIVGTWSKTFESDKNWFVRVFKTNFENNNITVIAYDNSNDPSTMSVSKMLNGNGWFDIPVNGLMEYMNNTINLTYSKFRLFTNLKSNISELRLRSEQNDSETPTIYQDTCQIVEIPSETTKTNFTCLEGIRFICWNITDDVGVDYVNFTINGVNYHAMKHIEHYEYDIYPDINGSVLYNWSEVSATDIVGNKSTESLNVLANFTCIYEEYINITHYPIEGQGQIWLDNTSVTIYWTTSNPSDSAVEYGLSPTNLNESILNSSYVTQHYTYLYDLIPDTTYYYSLISSVNPIQTLGVFNFTTTSGCVENWVADSYTCNISDQYILTYTDLSSCNTTDNLPPDNGTVQSCDYCSQDLVKQLGECQINGTQTVNYYDNNFYSCCAVTSFQSDCSILTYPYNSTTYQNCSYFNNTLGEITCQNEPNFNIREKEYCIARIPIAFLNESFRCISYVQLEDTDEILQTNPEYRERSASLLDLKQDPDTREWFTPANSLVSFYYTGKNLKPEQDYILTISCSSQQRELSSSMRFQMAYEDYEFVFFRTKWLMANASYIIGGLLLALIIMLVLTSMWGVIG